MRRLPLILALASMAGVLLLFYRIGKLEPAEPAPAQAGLQHDVHEADEHFEVAVSMGRIQRYHQKWWLAGKSGNADLARFYLHEMEEALEEIAESHVVDEGVDVSAQARAYGLPILDQLTRTLDSSGVATMHAMADRLVTNCNACHASTGHSYIRIQVPIGASFTDQDFAPAE